MPQQALNREALSAVPLLCAGSSWFHVLRAGTRAIVVISDDIGVFGQSAQDLLDELEGAETIDLTISSRGGDSNCALNLHNALKGRVRRATIKNRCYSAAVTLAMCAKEIEIEAGAKLMVHLPCVACYGQAEDLRCAANMLEKITGEISAVLQTKTRQPAQVVSVWLDGRDHYFDAKEAMALGLVDSIFEMPALPQEVAYAGAPQLAPTPDEQIFRDFLSAFGELQVRNRESFARELNLWFTMNVGLVPSSPETGLPGRARF